MILSKSLYLYIKFSIYPYWNINSKRIFFYKFLFKKINRNTLLYRINNPILFNT